MGEDLVKPPIECRCKIKTTRLTGGFDYSIVVNDAENILRVYETEGRIDVTKTYACDVKVRKAIDIQLTEEEKNGAVVIRDRFPKMLEISASYFEWHSRGQRFDPAYLHQTVKDEKLFSFSSFFNYFILQ